MANTYLSFSPTTGTNQKIFTFSLWFKRSGLGTSQWLVEGYGGGSHNTSIYLSGGNALVVFDEASSTTVATSKLFRDTNAWYNAVVAVDTTQSTASDRIKIYINGVQETSFSSSNYPAQNSNFYMTGNVMAYYIGKRHSGDYFDGSMSHVHQVDGIAYVPTTFGETDATTGEWKIKTSPTISDYGINGYFILKDGNSVTDQSGKGNNWTVGGGTLTKTEDCPDNVFATWNGVMDFASSGTFSNGNTQWNSGAISNRFWCTSSIGVSTGKWYVEIKNTVQGSHNLIGIAPRSAPALDWYLGGSGNVANADDDYQWGYKAEDGNKVNGTYVNPYGNTYGTTDIIGVALDLDNNKLYFSKNSVWQNSGDPESGSTGTGAISITSASSNPTGVYHIVGANATTGNASTFQANFGNGYFGTTAVASAGTNASGIGIFEYDVPTGFTALSTKGLNL